MIVFKITFSCPYIFKILTSCLIYASFLSFFVCLSSACLLGRVSTCFLCDQCCIYVSCLVVIFYLPSLLVSLLSFLLAFFFRSMCMHVCLSADFSVCLPLSVACCVSTPPQGSLIFVCQFLFTVCFCLDFPVSVCLC